MTAVERHVDEQTDAVWAVVYSPTPGGISCVYGEVFYGPHAHMLDTGGNPTPVLCSWEDDE